MNTSFKNRQMIALHIDHSQIIFTSPQSSFRSLFEQTTYIHGIPIRYVHPLISSVHQHRTASSPYMNATEVSGRPWPNGQRSGVGEEDGPRLEVFR